MIRLTANQELALNKCMKLLPHYKCLIIKGAPATGKHTVATELFSRINAQVNNFDLCEFASNLNSDLCNQTIIDYFKRLVNRFSYNDRPLSGSLKKKRIIDDMTDQLDNLSISMLAPEISYKIIYIRDYNSILDVLTDYYSKLRFFLPLIINRFLENIPDTIKVVITARGIAASDISELLYHRIELNTTIEDVREIISRNRLLSPEHVNILVAKTKNLPIGKVVYILKTLDHIDLSKDLITNFQLALAQLSNNSLDADKVIDDPSLETGLVGLEEIIEEINISIIQPIEYNIPGIPIKRGMIICGPPGTGKSSIGRWLAHKIKGRFYSIGGEAGMNGRNLVEQFKNILDKAGDQSSAVIFLDDCDLIFQQAEVYRGFLTILDGIENKKRKDICVILTCMNLKNIPASLIRGGRLEMILITQLPTRDKIEIVLSQLLEKLQHILTNYDPLIAENFRLQISKNLITEVAARMTGWNYADIHRCIGDISRYIISNNNYALFNLFENNIKKIRQQYELCAKTEATNLKERSTDQYIM